QNEFREQTAELLKFVFTHISEVDRTLTRKDMSELVRKLMKINIRENPFSERNFASYENNSALDLDEDILHGGLVEVVIKSRPKTSSFLFANDSRNQEYFLHYDKFKDGGWRDWLQLSIGEKLHVVPEQECKRSNKAIDVKEIYLAE
ncbi:TPA: hypothetical protein RUZ09_003454, partial [Vibrio cholerae]|nr:hypothetical protein [Vibrio cholerae]